MAEPEETVGFPIQPKSPDFGRIVGEPKLWRIRLRQFISCVLCSGAGVSVQRSSAADRETV